MTARPRGKPFTFSPEQVELLVKLARHIYAERRKKSSAFNQTHLGLLLNMGQQNAGLLLRKDDVGLSYPSATRIAILSGFEGVDELFRAYGVFKTYDPDEPDVRPMTGDHWPNRALGRTIALRLGASPTAIDRAIKLHADSVYRDRPPKWWMNLFLSETEAEEAGGQSFAVEYNLGAQGLPRNPTSAPPTTSPPVSSGERAKRPGPGRRIG